METRKLMTAGVLLGIFLAAVDGTVVTVAMPTVVASLGGLSLYSWVFTGYMLFTAATIPVFGRLSDIYGKKPLFVAGAAIFVTGSVLCGLSRGMLELIVFRSIQGAGAGSMLAIPYAIFGEIYPPEMRGKAVGWGSAMWGVASVIGPELGYVLVSTVGWRSVFFLNLPVGIVSIAIVWRYLDEDVDSEDESLDYWGTLTAAVGIVGVLLGVHEYADYPTLSLVAAGVGVLSLVGFAWVERRVEEPIIPLDLYRDRVFVSANAVAFLSSFVVFAAMTYIPLLMQAIRGGGALTAALAAIPLSIGWSGSSMTSGRFVARVGEQRLIRVGLVVLTLAFAGAAFWSATTPFWLILLNTLFMGVGVGSLTPPLMTSVQNHLGQNRMGIASSSYQLFRNVGSAMGISVLGAVLSWRVTQNLAGVPGLASFDDLQQTLRAGGGVPAGAETALVGGLSIMFAASVLVALLALLSSGGFPSFEESAATGGTTQGTAGSHD
ncbi:MAG: MDR family MFS transporter [Haloplanus sp.]